MRLIKDNIYLDYHMNSNQAWTSQWPFKNLHIWQVSTSCPAKNIMLGKCISGMVIIVKQHRSSLKDPISVDKYSSKDETKLSRKWETKLSHIKQRVVDLKRKMKNKTKWREKYRCLSLPPPYKGVKTKRRGDEEERYWWWLGL